jgi:hypothetical protein
MNVSVRSYLSSGLAAATATVIVVTPLEAQTPASAATTAPIALAVQAQPLQLPALIAEQVTFNAGVAVDFVVTGAHLIGQQAQVAQTLVDDVRTGTPVPVAVGRAVAGFTNIEVVAGHELVGFGRELADFQIQSLGNLVAQLPPVVAAPAGRALAVSARKVDIVSDVTNDAIDRLAQVVNIPVAQSQSRQTSRTMASRRLDNVVRRVTHLLRSPAARNAPTASASAADRTTAPHAGIRQLAAQEASTAARPHAHLQRVG